MEIWIWSSSSHIFSTVFIDLFILDQLWSKPCHKHCSEYTGINLHVNKLPMNFSDAIIWIFRLKLKISIYVMKMASPAQDQCLLLVCEWNHSSPRPVMKTGFQSSWRLRFRLLWLKLLVWRIQNVTNCFLLIVKRFKD